MKDKVVCLPKATQTSECCRYGFNSGDPGIPVSCGQCHALLYAGRYYWFQLLFYYSAKILILLLCNITNNQNVWNVFPAQQAFYRR